MIKPSELTPRFSALLAKIIAEHFAPDEISVITGDASVAQDFVSLPFDHLVFTGSTAVGAKVADAVAEKPDSCHLRAGWQITCSV